MRLVLVYALYLETGIFSGLKMLVCLPCLYDVTLPYCVAVCPEVTIRNSIVKGETSCPHIFLQTLSEKLHV